MEFRQLTGPVLDAEADLLAFSVSGDPTKDPMFKAVDAVLKGDLAQAAKDESFESKPLQALMVSSHGRTKARRILVVGAGPRGDLKLPSLRDLAATVLAQSTRVGAKSIVLVVPAVGAPRERAAVQLMVEGVLQGAYRFDRYLTTEDARRPLSVTKVGLAIETKGKKPSAAQTRAVGDAIARATVVSSAVNHARDLINEPAAEITPVALAAQAEAIAKRHKQISVTVLGPKKCEELGMGMFLAVGRGSDHEPRFIHLIYRPTKPAKKRIALIGKGITFDSGGYSLKPSQAMEDMKVDMSGAAAVISAMDAIAKLGSPYEVHALAACCENMVSGRAYKLGDVLKSMDGTTVEINNTDAEGRLTLGDAITYARTKIAPDEMFDFATLTGACMVALGPYTAGVMSDHDALVKGWLAATERAGEDMWRLPLNPRLREQLKSQVADMRNTGDRFGGAITAGLFLKTFAKDTPWVHVDIAGPASVSSARPAQPKGGTGFAVASIIEYVAPSA
jgi:leucyl aminopeptidase